MVLVFFVINKTTEPPVKEFTYWTQLKEQLDKNNIVPGTGKIIYGLDSIRPEKNHRQLLRSARPDQDHNQIQSGNRFDRRDQNASCWIRANSNSPRAIICGWGCFTSCCPSPSFWA